MKLFTIFTCQSFHVITFFAKPLAVVFVSLFFAGSVQANFNFRDVTAVEAAELLNKNPEIRVLDVRTGFEYRRGHLKNAININYYSRRFNRKLNELDKDITWLIHCRSGVRSGKTLPLMKEAGFSSVIHLTNGIVDWVKAGLPVVK